MNTGPLSVPFRSEKPRQDGLTVVIDNGIPVAAFEDAIASAADGIDLVKFGWGTVLVTPRLEEKTACLRRHGIGYFFGGTLFEKFVAQDLVEDYFELCRRHGCRYIEVSNGTIHLSSKRKAQFIARAAEEFVVLSEVGYKDAERSAALTREQWASFIEEDFAAGTRRPADEQARDWPVRHYSCWPHFVWPPRKEHSCVRSATHATLPFPPATSTRRSPSTSTGWE